MVFVLLMKLYGHLPYKTTAAHRVVHFPSSEAVSLNSALSLEPDLG